VLYEARGRFQIVTLEQSRCLPHLFNCKSSGSAKFAAMRRAPSRISLLVDRNRGRSGNDADIAECLLMTHTGPERGKLSRTFAC
jgi:hypothetical protein